MDAQFYSLSQPQLSIWFLEKKYPGTSMNNIAGTLRVKGKVDYVLLEKAINLCIQKNEGLRLRFTEQQGEAKQYVSPYKWVPVHFFDFSRGAGKDDLYEWDAKQTQTPFSILDEDLFYVALIKVGEQDGGMYVKLHHLISDAWTISLFGNMTMEYYWKLKKGEVVDTALNPSFVEHLKENERYEVSPRFEGDREYWEKKFEDFPDPTVLKAHAPGEGAEEGIEAARKAFVTPQKLSDKIRAYCTENSVSPFMLFLSALSIYIHRATAGRDITVGTTVLNRTNVREKGTLGMFVSVAAPVRIAIEEEVDFGAFVKKMRTESMSVLRHQKYPYNYLLKGLKKKNPQVGRLYDVVLSYQNSKFMKQAAEEEYFTRWHFTNQQVESLIIHINDREGEGNFILDYDYLTDVFNVKEIEFIHQHIISLLWHGLDNPGRKVTRLEMLSESEKRTILCNFNNTAGPFPHSQTLHGILEEQAEKTPGSTAVLEGEKSLTYSELNRRANRLAATLRALGVGPDTVVGIAVYRSLEMIVGLFGILKAGGAYLPISPDYPEDRVDYMLQNSNATVLLTQQGLMGAFGGRVTLINLNSQQAYTGAGENPPPVSEPQNLAYVIYTSGSTGKPKGVMVEHSSVINRLYWACGKYPLPPDYVILQKTPFTFDVSVWELFWWAFTGASVCMLQPGGEKDPAAIIAAVEKYGITTIHFVPSMLAAFLNYLEQRGGAERLATLRQSFSSGEALTLAQADKFNSLLNKENGTELYNMYGPTEATVEVSYFDCSPYVGLKSVPIGRPIGNLRLYVLDQNRNLLPVGIPGELYIGGVGVARGYINNPALTAQSFVEDPFYPGQKMYKTGDRVRWYPRGDIEYLGRIDFQVKIRGFRIELGEIENKILSFPHTKQAVVVGRELGGGTALCAYVVSGEKLDVEALRGHLEKALPDYMVPSFFVEMQALPLSANGKVDRKALPQPRISPAAQKQEPPADETEQALFAIWQQLLETAEFGVLDNFFEIGGDSLAAIALTGEVYKQLHADLPIAEIFRLQNIRQMAAYIRKAGVEVYEAIAKVPQAASYPMAPAQKRLFILDSLEEEKTHYNLPAVFEVSGEMNKQRLQQVWQQLIRRHEALRTTFALENGEPVQRIGEEAPFAVKEQQVGTRAQAQQAVAAFVQPFQLGQAPLLRVCLLHIAETRQTLLLFDMHHIISDGRSVNILAAEFAALYAGGQLPEIPVRYRDYSHWYNSALARGGLQQQENYWLGMFSGEIPVLNLPADYARPARKSFAGRRVSVALGGETSRLLKQLALQSNATLFMVLFAAYNVLLARYGGQPDVVVGTPAEGRLHADLRNVVGMFVNTLAIRSRPEGEKLFSTFLQEVKENLLLAYKNQEYPFELLVEKIGLPRDLGRTPLFDTMFVLQNMDVPRIEAGGLVLVPGAEYKAQTAKFDITLEAFDKGEEILLEAEYSTALFSEETIRRMLGHYVNIIEAVAHRPQQPIASISLLSEAERQLLLHSYNGEEADYPTQKSIHGIFEECVQRAPGSTAVVFEGQAFSYDEVNKRANQVARALQKKGVVQEDIVAIAMARGAEIVWGILGILKAGAAYLPIDPAYPEDRIRYMLQDSGAKLLLTQAELAPGLAFGAPLLCVESEEVEAESAENTGVQTGFHSLAYIIYTSGSTGRPKGVMVEHGNVVRLLFNSKFQFNFSKKDVWTVFHSFCFDFSVWEMYGALLYGGRLVVVGRQDAVNPAAFLQLLQKQGVTVLNQTPAAFYNLIREEQQAPAAALGLRYVIFGGEALNPAMLAPFARRYPQTKLINMYGITETTVHVTFRQLAPEDLEKNVSNIGRAIPTLKTYIVDANLSLQPVGVPGELCVSGPGLARGYLNNPETTAQKFVPSPFAPGERLYRSGDLARVLPGGDMEYMGRIDQQVKIRGYRIELGEIETAMLGHASVEKAFVMAREDAAGEKKLYAYFVAGEPFVLEELKSAMQQMLPGYMMPAYFIRLPEMPLNRNGKIDRAALPGADQALHAGQGYEAPKTPVETELAVAWQQVLGLEKVGVLDNFFEIGGDSLNAVRVLAAPAIRKYNITLVDLYTSPTIRALAAGAAHTQGGQERAAAMLVPLTPGALSAATQIICFPYGGGNAITYRSLADEFFENPARVGVLAVNLPGHDLGASGEVLPVEEGAALLAKEILENANGEIVLYGHCVGTAMLLQTARLLEKAQRPLKGVFVGAIFPPRFVKLYGGYYNPWSSYSNKRIVAYLSRMGLPKDALNNDYAGYVIKSYRLDAKYFYRYFYKQSGARLAAPLHFVAGTQDPITKGYAKRYKEWNSFGGPVGLHTIPGAGHYFLATHAKKLAEIIKYHL
ncbi:MAG: amino acid adenylation domain-containing protein [Oscillospiraceae bacterium]